MNVEKPYIGVTGVRSVPSAEKVAYIFSQNLSQSDTHQAMAGYLLSLDTLMGKTHFDTRYPSLEQLPHLLRTTSNCLNTIHYRTKDDETLPFQIEKVFKYGDIYDLNLCRTLQLNTSKPASPALLERLKMMFPDLDIILRFGPRVLNPENFGKLHISLSDYRDLTSYFLIDTSGGWQKSFLPEDIAPLFDAIRRSLPGKPIILAGGFDPKNVLPRLAHIAQVLQTKEFGIDSEGGLREWRGNHSSGYLAIHRVEEYVREADFFFNHVQI